MSLQWETHQWDTPTPFLESENSLLSILKQGGSSSFSLQTFYWLLLPLIVMTKYLASHLRKYLAHNWRCKYILAGTTRWLECKHREKKWRLELRSPFFLSPLSLVFSLGSKAHGVVLSTLGWIFPPRLNLSGNTPIGTHPEVCLRGDFKSSHVDSAD